MAITRARPLRGAAAVAVGIGGYVHLVLYWRSYHAIPRIGVLFALDIIVAAGVTMALLTRSDTVSVFVALAHSMSVIAGFVLSRTVGLWGFNETGFAPAPHAAIALAAEVAALALLAWLAFVSVRHDDIRSLLRRSLPIDRDPSA